LIALALSRPQVDVVPAPRNGTAHRGRDSGMMHDMDNVHAAGEST
jgi:hypothetical protein